MSRTYNQECVLAYALDLLGERWTLLIIRELFLGPRRFGDLHAALPGIGTNLLSKRLKELEESGLIVASAGQTRGRYRLSDEGEELRPFLREMMFWSIKYFMSRTTPSAPHECIYSNDLQPDSVALAAEMFANKFAIQSENYVLHLTIDDNSYTFYFMNREMIARRGSDTPAVAKITTDVATLMMAMRGEIYIEEIRQRAAMSGDDRVINHFVFSLTPGADVAFEVGELIKLRSMAKAAEASKPENTPVKEVEEA
ncbi:MAG: helix-turn-helix domain-containing protein [Pseudomonadota bacterium]